MCIKLHVEIHSQIKIIIHLIKCVDFLLTNSCILILIQYGVHVYICSCSNQATQVTYYLRIRKTNLDYTYNDNTTKERHQLHRSANTFTLTCDYKLMYPTNYQQRPCKCLNQDKLDKLTGMKSQPSWKNLIKQVC